MAISRAVLNASNDPGLAIPKCRQSQSMEKIDAQRAIERAWDTVKKFIFERDKGRCRLCGMKCWYGAAKLSEKADPHHIIFASAQGPDESWNLLLLCRGCHDLVHIVKRFYLSGNADHRDQFGKGVVKVERQGESGFVVVGFI